MFGQKEEARGNCGSCPFRSIYRGWSPTFGILDAGSVPLTEYLRIERKSSLLHDEDKNSDAQVVSRHLAGTTPGQGR